MPGAFVGFWVDLGNPGWEPGNQNAEGHLAGATDQLLQKKFSMFITCVDTLVHSASVSVLGQGIGFSLSLT